jgi:hypothetical protein
MNSNAFARTGVQVAFVPQLNAPAEVKEIVVAWDVAANDVQNTANKRILFMMHSP